MKVLSRTSLQFIAELSVKTQLRGSHFYTTVENCLCLHLYLFRAVLVSTLLPQATSIPEIILFCREPNFLFQRFVFATNDIYIHLKQQAYQEALKGTSHDSK